MFFLLLFVARRCLQLTSLCMCKIELRKLTQLKFYILHGFLYKLTWYGIMAAVANSLHAESNVHAKVQPFNHKSIKWTCIAIISIHPWSASQIELRSKQGSTNGENFWILKKREKLRDQNSVHPDDSFVWKLWTRINVFDFFSNLYNIWVCKY